MIRLMHSHNTDVWVNDEDNEISFKFISQDVSMKISIKSKDFVNLNQESLDKFMGKVFKIKFKD